MNEIIGKAALEAWRIRFKPGTRVELVHMGDDPYSKLKPGDRGTVNFVDDAGGVHTAWDNGEGLAAIYGVDEIRQLTVIPDDVIEEILALRKFPNCPNMFDARTVQRLAYNNEFYALVNFIEGNLKAYGRFILTGQREW